MTVWSSSISRGCSSSWHGRLSSRNATAPPLIRTSRNQYHGRSKYYSQYLHAAISLAVDMRLDRKPLRPKPTNAGTARNPVTDKPGMLTVAWGPEEQRAAAGLFYIASV
jgi:hypothetical protein